MSLSGIPKQDTDLSRWMERLFGTAGFPWWWHTRDDTIDKIDADVLALDTKVYVAAALRLVDAPVLPLDHVRFARGPLASWRSSGAAGPLRPRAGPRGRPRISPSGRSGSPGPLEDAASDAGTRRARRPPTAR